MMPMHGNRPPMRPNSPGSYFTADDIKLELLRKQRLISPGGVEMYPEVPEMVDNYRELVPLENSMVSTSTSFGYVSSVYRAVNISTGEIFCLRRIHGFQATMNNYRSLCNAIDSWKKIEHSNMVSLRQIFTTKAFGDNSLIFVYDFFPGSQTLMDQIFTHPQIKPFGPSVGGHSSTARPYSQQQPFRNKLLPESVIWTIIIQLSSAIRTIHANNLACRAIDPTKIIITSGGPDNGQGSHYNQFMNPLHLNPRVRLSSCGVFDVISPNPFPDMPDCPAKALIPHLQREDLVSFGKVLCALACNSLSAMDQDSWPQSYEVITRNYNGDLRTLIFFLLTAKRGSTINEIMPMIGGRFYAQLDMVYQRYDLVESQLAKELDNGRLFRLLTKLGTINERPEFRMDPQWSETGDRYLLKLFRDYIFHQVDENGQPWIDMGHIVSTLNKLDVGSPEKICLVSRDDQNVLIVSFCELKKCFEAASNELLRQY
ncbi:poly(A) specific ribonuclease subunit PAN3 [Brevipalpus obovatus]|uniref:poly(A) specific ribonuclease subunit PAN3 n=1 Tax=Brevipalpus obovatus TaxID=246614 RepID=UPI003D9F6C4C